MYVRAEFSPVEAREAILAPQTGISRDVKGNATALVIGADSKAELRTLTTDRTVGDRWLVSKGLAPGDRIIVEGLGRIKPGQVVRPVEILMPAPEAAEGPAPSGAAPAGSAPGARPAGATAPASPAPARPTPAASRQ
ncbi:MAG: HlyD family secretion protein [Gammaproteobacteria bacterium]